MISFNDRTLVSYSYTPGFTIATSACSAAVQMLTTYSLKS